MSVAGSLGVIAGSGGAAAAAATNQRLIADGTAIANGGDLSDAGGDVINLTLPDGTAAAVVANGLSGLYGGIVWSLGDTLKGGLGSFVEWVTRQNSVIVCVGFMRASSAPSSLAELESSSGFLQMNIKADGTLNCFHKEEAQALNAITQNTDNLASAAAVVFQAAAGPLGFERRQHVSWNEANDQQKDNVDATQVLDSGDWYLFLAYGAGTTISGDTTIQLKLNAGFPL